jgi:hypothetical protein
MPLYNGSEAAWPHGSLIDMAKSPEQVRKEAEPMASCAPSPCPVPEYPWGLCISLENETLAKLGLDGDPPQVGDILEFFAAAKVTSASMREEIDPATGAPKSCCRVELQIVGMLPHEEETAGKDRMEEQEARSAGRRQRFYGGSMPSYDRDVAGYRDARDAGGRP